VSRIFAIDPGPEKSAFVIWNGGVCESGELSNPELRQSINDGSYVFDTLAIEMIACYGMAVGAETFETCVWIGRIMQVAESWTGLEIIRVYRKDVKMHLCHSMRAKDANIRQALIDKHGIVGTKKNPGKLFGIAGHMWAALAVADYVADVCAELLSK
jgi:hypothetical protein